MIFCVEDDTGIRELMLYTMKASGIEAIGFQNASDFWKGMQSCVPELIFLDIMLPDEDGITILKKLRDNIMTADIPVIIASAKGTEYDKVIGLDLGADDYLAKPFGMMEMLSRIRAVLRRKQPTVQSKLLKCGRLQVNEVSHEVRIDSRPIELTLKEYELLRLFMRNPCVVFTRDQLLSAVWNSDFVGETRTVDVHIASLRTKLGTAGNSIKTIRGVGYRWENIE